MSELTLASEESMREARAILDPFYVSYDETVDGFNGEGWVARPRDVAEAIARRLDELRADRERLDWLLAGSRDDGADHYIIVSWADGKGGMCPMNRAEIDDALAAARQRGDGEGS